MIKRISAWATAGLLCASLGMLLTGCSGEDAGAPDTAHPQPAAPKFEAKQKQELVDRDIAITGELCRQQCSAELGAALRQLQPAGDADEIRAKLQRLREEHPHMLELVWKGADGRRIEVGGLEPSLRASLAEQLREADSRLAAGKRGGQGEDPAVSGSGTDIGGDRYLVLSVPGREGGGIIGVVRQSILQHIANHQRNNLRLVPYPPEGKYQIESVDSDTKRDIHVDNGEENGGASHYHKQQVVVKFKTPPSVKAMERIKQELGAASVRRLGYTYLIESRQQTAEQMLAYFNRRSDVEYAEPHYLYMTNDAAIRFAGDQGGELPNDELFAAYQWNLPITQTLSGWSISKGSGEVVVAVLDTGVDLAHPDLAGRLADGINVVEPGLEPTDDVGHGTHVTGVISAAVNNGEGIAGMTWHDKVMPVKVLGADGAGTTYSVAEGLIWAVDHGAKVINMSLGNYADAQFLHDAIRYAYDRDVVLIAATGNDNTRDPGYPAAYPEVLAVSAVDDQLERAPFSNYGDYIDVVAPGVSIASTYPHNQYAALSGTSMASPHVAALAALIRSVNPELRNTEVMDIMRHTARDLGPEGRDELFGYGQINVEAALAAAAQSNMNAADQQTPSGLQEDSAERKTIADPQRQAVDSQLLRRISDWFMRELERIHAERLSNR